MYKTQPSQKNGYECLIKGGMDMIVLIGGATHTGKTRLAQQILEQKGLSYLSIDHLKMGLIRAGHTKLTPVDDAELTGYLWPIVVEMIKTAIENEQHLTVEGIYIPCDWKKDFPPAYAKSIRAFFLVMSETYIRTHFDTIRIHADAMEKRKFPQDLTMEKLMDDNLAIKKACEKADQDIVWIDEEYPEITL